jgi:hypothetical protein
MEKDIFILVKFIHTYCVNNHNKEEKTTFASPQVHLNELFSICNECTLLAHYAIDKRMKCPQKNKPSCKKCTIKCYSQEYRSKIRKAMKFSGIYFIKKGRIDYLFKYFF